MHDSIKNDELVTHEVKNKLLTWLRNSPQQKEICKDLRTGLHTMPLWMRRWVEELLISL